MKLKPHPSWHRDRPMSVECSISRAGYAFVARFIVDADIDQIIVPEPAAQVRTDGLWRSTCFELFLRRAGRSSYYEFNMSPSGAWAAYSFDGYREGMADADLEPAEPILVANRIVQLEQTIVLDPNGYSALDGELEVGLSAVIEQQDGVKSYWALAHAAGPPDFHHEACFAATLPPIG
jgi:hypothetical protein